MARGVGESEVFEAADALLGAGERPTVERVRLHLRRGSPNTIGPLLDAWWTQLSQRLEHRLALPEVPQDVGVALAQVWELALAAGRAQADAALAPERAFLADALAAVEARVTAERERVTGVEAERQQALAASQVAEAALAICEQRAGELAAQVGSLQRQLEEMSGRRDAIEVQLHSTQSRLEQERTAAAAEREALHAHLRQVEDRAYGEVDRIRQDLKAEKARTTALVREHATSLRASDQARRAAETAFAKAQRELAAVQSRLARTQAARPTGSRSAPRRQKA